MLVAHETWSRFHALATVLKELVDFCNSLLMTSATRYSVESTKTTLGVVHNADSSSTASRLHKIPWLKSASLVCVRERESETMGGLSCKIADKSKKASVSHYHSYSEG